MRREVRHIPVLMDEVLTALDPRPGKVIVDCTVGLGGHSREILARVMPEGRLIAMDMDPASIERARPALAQTGGRFELYQGNFAGLPTVLALAGVQHVDGVLADLGVASPQIDDPARGFSYRRPGPLDMRMDPTKGQPAWQVLHRLSEQELAEILRELGDEEDAEAIARLVVARRKQSPIMTTQDLMAIVCEARDFTIARAAGAKLHPAARTFQALRMMVNREIGNLQRLLAVLPDSLSPGGVGAIISFHSGEDRLVKKAFKQGLEHGVYAEISPDPIMAGDEEREANSRSRSAKLRWARRAEAAQPQAGT